MATGRCPCCGQNYNGKRCKNCYYEPFGEIRSSWEARPVVHSAPQKPEKPAAYPQRKTTSRKRTYPVVKIIAILWALLVGTGMLGGITSAVLGNMAVREEVRLQPEPVNLPENGLVLYEDADLLVLADWDGVSPVTEDIPIYVRNFSSRDLVVCTDGVAVNGCMVNNMFFYCEAYRDSVCKATLWLDPAELEQLGIGQVRGLELALDVVEADDYHVLVEDFTVLCGEDCRQTGQAAGTSVYDRNGVTVMFQGWDTDINGNTTLRFYVENETGEMLELTSDELLLDGEGTGTYLWQRFFPGTGGLVYGTLYHGKWNENGGKLAMELFLTPGGDWERETRSGLLEIQLN